MKGENDVKRSEIYQDKTLTAKRIRELASINNEKAQDICDKTGVSKYSMSQYFNGVHAMSNVNAKKISDVYGVDPLWLMGFDVPMYKQKEDGFDKAIEYMKKHKVLYDIMLAGGQLLEVEEKDNESTLKLLEAYYNALTALNQKGKN